MKVKTPKEDPRIKSARDAEERRADAAFIETTGQVLDEETRKRIRRYGNRGSAVKAVAGGGSGGAAGGTGSGGGSYDPGAGGGYASGGGGNNGRTDSALV